MEKLFQSVSSGQLRLRNRLVRSATWERMSEEDGTPTQDLIDLMAQLAANQVGLIITSHAFVSPEGKAGPGQLGIHDDALLPQLRQMADAVHRCDGAIVVQLAHGGLNAFDFTMAIGPSAITAQSGKSCRQATTEDIAHVVAAFRAAAVRAQGAGLDGVQIHAAHGYLLSEFLSPYYNKRTDEYGGTIANRARLLLEVVAAVREGVGESYPVIAKLNSEDFVEGGFSVEDMVAVAKMLQEAGIDAIELSGGTIYEPGRYGAIRQGSITREEEGYYLAAAKRCKEQVKVPLILVGGIRTPEVAEEIVASGAADFISLSRPLIREPELIKRWASGDLAPAKCVSCNSCFGPLLAGKGFYCPLEKTA